MLNLFLKSLYNLFIKDNTNLSQYISHQKHKTNNDKVTNKYGLNILSLIIKSYYFQLDINVLNIFWF